MANSFLSENLSLLHAALDNASRPLKTGRSQGHFFKKNKKKVTTLSEHAFVVFEVSYWARDKTTGDRKDSLKSYRFDSDDRLYVQAS